MLTAKRDYQESWMKYIKCFVDGHGPPDILISEYPQWTLNNEAGLQTPLINTILLSQSSVPGPQLPCIGTNQNNFLEVEHWK